MCSRVCAHPSNFSCEHRLPETMFYGSISISIPKMRFRNYHMGNTRERRAQSA